MLYLLIPVPLVNRSSYALVDDETILPKGLEYAEAIGLVAKLLGAVLVDVVTGALGRATVCARIGLRMGRLEIMI